jgi:hypothetical protein
VYAVVAAGAAACAEYEGPDPDGDPDPPINLLERSPIVDDDIPGHVRSRHRDLSTARTTGTVVQDLIRGLPLRWCV